MQKQTYRYLLLVGILIPLLVYFPLLIIVVTFILITQDEITKPGKTKYIPYHEYQAYLKTQTWQAIRKSRLMFDGYRCKHCQTELTEETAHCHHLTYDRLGDENMLTDVISLCRGCHEQIHLKD